MTAPLSSRHFPVRFFSSTSSSSFPPNPIRFVQVVVDLSRASLVADMRPSRLKVVSEELQVSFGLGEGVPRATMLTPLLPPPQKKISKIFVRKFFDSNPLSQLSICCTRNGVAKVITELSGSPHRHVEHLKLLGTQKLGLDCAGDASVQNCLELATRQLRDVPPYGHREVLFVMTSLTTCDPGDVFEVGKIGRRLAMTAQARVLTHLHLSLSLPGDRGGQEEQDALLGRWSGRRGPRHAQPRGRDEGQVQRCDRGTAPQAGVGRLRASTAVSREGDPELAGADGVPKLCGGGGRRLGPRWVCRIGGRIGRTRVTLADSPSASRSILPPRGTVLCWRGKRARQGQELRVPEVQVEGSGPSPGLPRVRPLAGLFCPLGEVLPPPVPGSPLR